MIRIPAVQFTYDIWRAGSLTELGIPHREWSILNSQSIIRDMGVGFTEGFRLHFRPKPNYIAVMFFIDEKHFWTHLTRKEFLICFPELKNGLKKLKN